MTGTPNPELRQRVVSAYQAQFAVPPEIVVFAPGRINLIGEHTDYNMGLVLPGAVQYGIYFALGVNPENKHSWTALDHNNSVVLSGADVVRKHGGWIDYILGAWLEAGKHHPNPPLFNCVFSGDLPEGAGLSSSSALTCGVLFGLQSMLGLSISRADLAWMAHLVEHGYVGLRGGIMDQHASLLARAGHLLLLDCRDRSYQQTAFDTEAVSLFLVNTNVRHNLTETDYNTRADECAQAVQILQQQYEVESLRDVEAHHLETMRSALGPVLYRRARFVLAENNRVLHSVECIKASDWPALGQDLYASHRGLQNEYAVSCAELDSLVDYARWEDWIYGARMMGGGFGGCVLFLANRLPDPAFEQRVEEQYFLAFGYHPTFISIELSDGARILP